MFAMWKREQWRQFFDHPVVEWSILVLGIVLMILSPLAPFNARPHWGKLFTMSPEHLKSLYKKLPGFQELLQQYDPQAKFHNTFLDTYIF